MPACPYVKGKDPKRNLRWRAEDFSGGFIIGGGLLLGAAPLGGLAVVR